MTGYLLESISIDFGAGGSRTYDPVYMYLHEDNGNGRPDHNNGGQVATLTKNGVNFEGPVAGVNKYTVWKARCYPRPPHGGGCISEASSVHLEMNTTYWVFLWAGEQATTARLNTAFLGTPDTAAAGWSLSNSALAKPQGTTFSNYTDLGVALKLKIEGTTNPEVLVSINDVTVTEDVDLTADFVVSLSPETSGLVTMKYGTSSDSADQDNDYESTFGTLTFQPGETQKTISVPILDDGAAEGDEAEGDEVFYMVLHTLKGGTFAAPNQDGNGEGTGIIVNAAPLTVSISDATATEGDDATIDFTVSLNRATNRRFTLNSVNEPSETFTIILQSLELTTDYLILADSSGTGTILNTETLTASFENIPQDHNGSNAFTFNVAFDNDVSITPTAMRDHAFTVTSGDVTGAEHVNGSSTRWAHHRPSRTAATRVTITLPGNRDCATQGAICSDEDNPVQLGNSPSATVAAPPEGDPLTASFSNVPGSHNGSDFFIDLTFQTRAPMSAGGTSRTHSASAEAASTA